MQTLLLGLVLTLAAVVSLGISGWQNGRARTAGERAADESLRTLERRREGTGSHADGAEVEELLRAQRRHASQAYALKRTAIILLAVGLLGVLGGSLDVLL